MDFGFFAVNLWFTIQREFGLASVKKILKYSASAALAIILLYFSFRGVDWNEFWKVLTNCHWGFVLLAMALGAAGFLIRAFRWQLLIRPIDRSTPVLSCYDAFTIGKMADFVLPHIGEFVRCGYLSSRKRSYDKVLGTVVLERSWDLLTLAALILALLLFKREKFASFFMERILGPLTAGLNLSVWWIAAIALAAIVALAAVVIALKKRSRLCSKICSFVKGLFQGASSCLKMEGKWLFLLYTVLLWLSFLMMSLFIIKALPHDYGLTSVDALSIMLVGSIAGIVPVPGGFGAFHYLVAIALQTLYGIPFEMGIIFATLSHESQVLTTIATGTVSYVHHLLLRERVEDNVQEPQPQTSSDNQRL